jgi:hypothetical protein
VVRELGLERYHGTIGKCPFLINEARGIGYLVDLGCVRSKLKPIGIGSGKPRYNNIHAYDAGIINIKEPQSSYDTLT